MLVDSSPLPVFWSGLDSFLKDVAKTEIKGLMQKSLLGTYLNCGFTDVVKTVKSRAGHKICKKKYIHIKTSFY